MTAVCRFAPSPTGSLHVGGARTALFNWAFTRHVGGQFRLRIEDTDRSRSSAVHEQSISDALAWLGLQVDGEVVRQSERGELYESKVMQLVEEGHAYRCYTTPAELDELRASQEARGEKPRYDRRWRTRRDYPSDRNYCIRFATPLSGVCVIKDWIRGTVEMANAELDDPVIMRMDQTPTYNFAAAVDDIEMGVTHVIRGEDHLTNTLRQVHIHTALGGTLPSFAHLPLILGRKADASGEVVYERLSKRNMAVDIEHYRAAGYLPEALVNYLAQLGWTQPDTEIYLPADLVREFDLHKVNRSAARFDLERLRWVNQQHMRLLPPAQLAKRAQLQVPDQAVTIACEKAANLVELRAELHWLTAPSDLDGTLQGQVAADNKDAFILLCHALGDLMPFTPAAIKDLIRSLAKEHNLKFPRLGMPLRIALTGRDQSPDIAQVAGILGPEECRQRLATVLALLH